MLPTLTKSMRLRTVKRSFYPPGRCLGYPDTSYSTQLTRANGAPVCTLAVVDVAKVRESLTRLRQSAKLPTLCNS